MKARKGVRPFGYSDPRGYDYAVVDLDLLLPDVGNPRIPPQESVLQAIRALVSDDANALYNLGKDIVERGTDPGLLLNVSPAGEHFVVKDGNRRITAYKLLRNPELLRDTAKHEVSRWAELAKTAKAKQLPTALLVAIGDDHEVWIDRRHLGPQSGMGTMDWGFEAKARRGEQRGNKRNRTLALLDGIKTASPGRFDEIAPPERTLSTLARLVDSVVVQAHIGLDVRGDGTHVLKKGEKSLRLLEEILRDLRKTNASGEKLTSRTINSTENIEAYLKRLDARIGKVEDKQEIPLVVPIAPTPRTKKRKKKSSNPSHDMGLLVPSHTRLRKLHAELTRAHENNSPNAAMVLTRVLFELSSDRYANRNNLFFAGDEDVALANAVEEFVRDIGIAKVTCPKPIRDGLKTIAKSRVSAKDKLSLVIEHLASTGRYPKGEAAAKKRELKDADVVAVLNDAVHRLDNEPSLKRVEHVVAVLLPIYNLITET